MAIQKHTMTKSNKSILVVSSILTLIHEAEGISKNGIIIAKGNHSRPKSRLIEIGDELFNIGTNPNTGNNTFNAFITKCICGKYDLDVAAWYSQYIAHITQGMHIVFTSYLKQMKSELDIVDITCPICLNNMKTKCMTTNCHHAFHIQCIGQWCIVHDTCPICRSLL
jgi:hypothetical protein